MLFQNGRHFSVLLFDWKLALVASVKGNILLNFKFQREATRGNLKVNKRTLWWRPFWNKVYWLQQTTLVITSCQFAFFCLIVARGDVYTFTGSADSARASRWAGFFLWFRSYSFCISVLFGRPNTMHLTALCLSSPRQMKTNQPLKIQKQSKQTKRLSPFCFNMLWFCLKKLGHSTHLETLRLNC